ncbi:DUF6043 family protein [Alistipes sp.]|uniref:DUF6043 family protein n=1 Tax=Alistipes sp. TaxID=1872444 RepID=UPI0025C5DEFA|nr:DUF6043 family protein [Alistipes sp.]
MGQQEYDNFKRLIKEWLDSHPDEYAAFVREINDKNFKGFFKIFNTATRLVPKYRQVIGKRICDERHHDFEELETLILQSDLAAKIIGEFQTSSPKSIIPAMIAWLYYGRSYECMVEQGEQLIRREDISGLYRWLVSHMIRYIIKKSISSGMRTQEEWADFRRQQRAIEENRLVEWSIEELSTSENISTKGTNKTVGRKADVRTLPELLIGNAHIIEKIGERLKTQGSETDIARLYIALVECHFMYTCPIKTFRNALQRQYEGINIVHERGIQKAYRNLTSPWGNSRKLMKDIGEDLAAIEELKAYLFD